MALFIYPDKFTVCLFVLIISLSKESLQQNTMLTKDKTFKLNTGDAIPAVGFGTYQVQGTELVKNVIDLALASGYRLIDTAALYKNEEDIGKALKELLPKYNLTRKDIFITTKLYPYNQGQTAYKSLQQSLRYLDCDYIDLYLIHWPGVLGANLTTSQLKKSRDDGWQQLIKGKKDGLTRNIGVSNYNIGHLTELLENDHGFKPSVNQVEFHPKYHSDELLNFCRKEGILLQAYSSLGGTNNKDLLGDLEVKKIAQKLKRTPAQVLLRWALQQNIAVIPKARSKKYIEENIDLNFNIPEADMSILNNFKRVQYSWNPDTIA
nr:uncharacterized protein LOC111516418 [Leptinotarsa decemlineata]